ncbi:MAG TPA: translation elongation factor Ts [Bacillota bacterium]|nr:translation elongation factor Ts [Bacillota bacterium]HOH10305.1 translation elongation factor Ts [Bacillota bacterium]HOY89183.1 translation elongation factor Ts [Bacillota bacterium]HPI01688.1 translation elongation factor Ts [Bacillota bacterium]HPM63880.1 translation elongation factor Ts [Bacillota bacterium]
MPEIKAAEVQKLRELSQAGMMDCKRALIECEGNMEKAVQFLREKGLARAEKRSGRATSEGMVDSYIHMGGRIGVLVEVNCETDFVAKNEQFKTLVKEIAMQIAAQKPLYVKREDIPSSIIEAEKEIYRHQAANEGKKPEFAEKIAEGRLEKFFKETCLVDQAYIRDQAKSVSDLVKETASVLGENIQIRRFARFERGEEEPEKAE